MESRLYHAVMRQLSIWRETKYNSETGMIQQVIENRNYHTSVSDGVVHPVRDNLSWLPALLRRGWKSDRETALRILYRVLEAQDKNPDSDTYGIWPYLFEEPINKMKNPDWNWAAFQGSTLIILLKEFPEEFSEELAGLMREALYCACESILRRNMGVDYTNISLMTSFVLVLSGELLGEESFYQKGCDNLKRQLDFVLQNGGYAEYNSPTYGVLDIEETGKLLRYSGREEIQKLARSLHNLAWKVFAEHYHPSTGQLAAPHARSYEDVQSNLVRTLITIGTKGKCELEPEETWNVNLQWLFMTLECPEELYRFFAPQTEARVMEETFYRGYDPIKNDELRVLIEKGTPPVSSYTYLYPGYCLGTFDKHDMWNQRRPLMAYFAGDGGIACFRVRCMHDDMDFAGAIMSNIQKEGAVAGGISFVTDHGDYHYILTPLEDGRMTADCLAIEFVMTGAVEQVKLGAVSEDAWCFSVGKFNINVKLLDAVFGEEQVKTEIFETKSGKGVRVGLSGGNHKEIDFKALERAFVLYWLEITEGENEPQTYAKISHIPNPQEGSLNQIELIAGDKSFGKTAISEKPGRYMEPLPGLTKVFKNGGFYYRREK